MRASTKKPHSKKAPKKDVKKSVQRITDKDIDLEAALTPRALTKQEFGRRLLRSILDRGWNQSELARQAGVGKDAISTYVNGRSFPDPGNLRKIAMALGVEPGSLLPNTIETAMDRELPAFEMKQAVGMPNRVWLRINRAVNFGTAAKIVELLRSEQEEGDLG